MFNNIIRAKYSLIVCLNGKNCITFAYIKCARAHFHSGETIQLSTRSAVIVPGWHIIITITFT